MQSKTEQQKEETLVLLIDCQQAFIDGSWARYFPEREIEPLKAAFERVGEFLRGRHPPLVAATICPFWREYDRRIFGPLRELLEGVPTFEKPDNDVFEAPGWDKWVREAIAQRSVKRLVVGGCTLNSCVRVSVIQCARRLRDTGVKVCVDISLCGARASNYTGNDYGGLSSVGSAIAQMKAAGAVVYMNTNEWNTC